MVGSGTTTPSSPTTRSAARRASSATAASLTTGGLPARTSTSARHCRPAATPDAMRVIRSGIERRSSASKVRMVPVSVTSSGMTLKACAAVDGADGDHRRLQRRDLARDDVCSAVTTWAAATTGIGGAVRLAAVAAAAVDHDLQAVHRRHERPRLHARACPPAARSRGGRRARTSTPSSTPSAITACAPPSPSSAGWNSTRTRPASRRPARMRAAAGAHRHVAVVAAGVHDAGHLRRVGRVVLLLDGQRVHVHAQQHACGRAPPAMVASTPVPPTPVRSARPAPSRKRGDARRGARLRVGQLGMLVQVAAQRDELVAQGEDVGRE